MSASWGGLAALPRRDSSGGHTYATSKLVLGKATLTPQLSDRVPHGQDHTMASTYIMKFRIDNFMFLV
jgi:hypothetical protein